MLRAACPDWHSDVEQLVEEGDVVVSGSRPAAPAGAS